MAMSSQAAQAEIRRLTRLLAESVKKVERLEKALEEGGENEDELNTQLEEALRRLEEAQQQQKQQQQAAPADRPEVEQEVRTLSAQLAKVRSFCKRLQRSQQHARNELHSAKWVIVQLRYQLKQAQKHVPEWYRQKMQQEEQEEAARRQEREQEWAARQQQHRAPQQQQQQQQQPPPPLGLEHVQAAWGEQQLQPFQPAPREQPHPQAAAAARQPPPSPEPAAAVEVPTADVGVREVKTRGWSRVFAAGLGGVFLLMLALVASTSIPSSGVEPMAFSGSSMLQAVSAMGREAGYRAGIAMRAEDAVAFWRTKFYEEERGREAAEQQASTLRAELSHEHQQLLSARQSIDRLEQQQQSTEQQRRALEVSLSQQKQQEERVGAERDALKANLTLVGAERDHLQARLAQTEADLASEMSKTLQLVGELTMERAAVDDYSKRIDVEVTARRDAESLAVRLVAEMLDAKDKLSQCAQQRSSCSNALTGCHQQKKQAEERADRLADQKQYACVGWLADVASNLRSALFSPVPSPATSHAGAYALPSTVYYN